VALVLLSAAVSAALAAFAFVRSTSTPPPRAALVDQLSLTAPNPEFIDGATGLLEQAGYSVDYYPGEQVSIELFRDLPTRGYDFVLLRVHSARREEPSGKTDEAVLFTAELIDLDYYGVVGVPPVAATAIAEAKAEGIHSTGLSLADDRLSPEELARVSPVFYDPGSGELPFFGLRPSFIEHDLVGTFDHGATLVLMGCDGLRSSELGDAFLARGAGTFVSWDRPVSATHTDAATLQLLERLLVDGKSIDEAVGATMDGVGPDPVSGSRLSYLSAPD
jgi:hypothetical protein